MNTSSDKDRTALSEAVVVALEKNRAEEWLFPEGSGSGPFFHGSETLTLAEVLTGAFLLRLLDFPKPQYGLLDPELVGKLEARAPRFLKWAKAVVAEEAVNYIWDAERVAKRMIAKAKAAKV